MKSPPPPSSPWQLFYGGAHRLRSRWYRARSRRLPRPVISIGNLHWGGTGKTPLVAAVAAHLRDRGLAVCILSRGYASRGRGVRVVSTGEGPLLGPLLAGDEPVLLSGELPGVSVVVGPDRYEAGMAALRRLPRTPDLFLLDDGFSHLTLRRDLDLVAFPATDPFGGGRLFPSGRLREPLSSIARAHAVLLTGAKSPEEGQETAEALRFYGFTGPGFASFTRPGQPRRLGGSIADLLPGAKVFLVTAIARPDRFVALARQLGFEITGELRFPDHHAYPLPSLERIRQVFLSSGAVAVLTTVKDAVKLLGRLDAPLFELSIRADPEPAFWEWLDGRWRP
ncbi:MAG TPA: tetraacyldisaccharide 4'-kinase [Thermoanaerobaculia bacterium]|nr:tetraacyldisaccharide 4'-kinase [Thermoanaerobaculia bacterium]